MRKFKKLLFYVQPKDLDFRFKNYVRFYFTKDPKIQISNLRITNPKISIFDLRITYVCFYFYNPKNKFVLNIGVLNVEIYPRFFHNFSFKFLLKLNKIPISINIDTQKFSIFPLLTGTSAGMANGRLSDATANGKPDRTNAATGGRRRCHAEGHRHGRSGAFASSIRLHDDYSRLQFTHNHSLGIRW